MSQRLLQFGFHHPVFLVCVTCALTMAFSGTIDQYFKPIHCLPSPNGPLSATIPAGRISKINQAVEEAATKKQISRNRGTYIKLTDEEKAEIARYALQKGNVAAAKCYTEKRGKEIKESSVRS